jgi:hypothetical protein
VQTSILFLSSQISELELESVEGCKLVYIGKPFDVEELENNEPIAAKTVAPKNESDDELASEEEEFKIMDKE